MRLSRCIALFLAATLQLLLCDASRIRRVRGAVRASQNMLSVQGKNPLPEVCKSCGTSNVDPFMDEDAFCGVLSDRCDCCKDILEDKRRKICAEFGVYGMGGCLANIKAAIDKKEDDCRQKQYEEEAAYQKKKAEAQFQYTWANHVGECQVTASSSWDSAHGPENVLFDDQNKVWHSGIEAAPYVTFSFDDAFTIAGIRVKVPERADWAGKVFRDYRIEYSADGGGTWATARAGQGENQKCTSSSCNFQEILFTPKTARLWRLHMLSCWDPSQVYVLAYVEFKTLMQKKVLIDRGFHHVASISSKGTLDQGVNATTRVGPYADHCQGFEDPSCEKHDKLCNHDLGCNRKLWQLENEYFDAADYKSMYEAIPCFHGVR
eukprot:gnl/TRDRNA2_/TRDRNA2_86041_c0_seq1.p1 gnl/TRDRNA2_/TRDRNA2_86041_c0~~gnl/TRDRNA2_/TRDRNA2_86041_c0_seq1.p1  ORF type:complete len:377 (-),score=56.23 gnl/TRDRNA2_/TRDRNA2_86041_c0_seq1:147-1277(-)